MIRQNKNIKIVVFHYSELTQRAIDEIALDELAECFDLEYWNCRTVSYPADPPLSPKRIIQRPYVRNIRNMWDLKRQLAKLPKDTIGLIWLLQNPKMYRVHKAIGAKVASAVFYSLNVNDSKAGLLTDEEQKHPQNQVEQTQQSIEVKRSALRSFWGRIKSRLRKNDTLYLLYNYIRYNGKDKYKSEKDRIYYSKLIHAYRKLYRIGVAPWADMRTSHPDYDKILKLGTQVKRNEPYIVYIDESYMDSLDAIERFPNIDMNSMRGAYYESINRFFDRVELEYKCKVVVALHPNAFAVDNPFNGRECIQYKTVELVKDCQGVILHASNAINFIAYYDKPICYTYNNVLSQFDFPGSLYTLGAFQCRQLNLPYINMEELSSVKNIFHKLTLEIRQAVIDRYFGDISRGIPNSEILKEHFVTIYNEINS